MTETAWYLISYDIRDPRRLRRAHQLLRRQTHPLLESLFAYRGSPRQLQSLQEHLAQCLSPADDLLIYRLRTDCPMQRWGTACLPEGLYDFSLPPLVEHRLAGLGSNQLIKNQTT